MVINCQGCSPSFMKSNKVWWKWESHVEWNCQHVGVCVSPRPASWFHLTLLIPTSWVSSEVPTPVVTNHLLTKRLTEFVISKVMVGIDTVCCVGHIPTFFFRDLTIHHHGRTSLTSVLNFSFALVGFDGFDLCILLISGAWSGCIHLESLTFNHLPSGSLLTLMRYYQMSLTFHFQL